MEPGFFYFNNWMISKDAFYLDLKGGAHYKFSLVGQKIVGCLPFGALGMVAMAILIPFIGHFYWEPLPL